MTFEEFFRKKRIDLAALEVAEASLFSEFKTHFEQMGEKSFDHTKKYWFNKLRRQFPLAPEVKTDKPHIANPLAEQTITESLTETETGSPHPKMAFVPKFRVANVVKQVINTGEEKENIPSEKRIENTIAKPAYKPRFNMKTIPPKQQEE